MGNNMSKNKVSGIIITKNEDYELATTINYIKNYLNEVIVIDSSDNELARVITNDLGCVYKKLKIGDKDISGIADLRNYGHDISKNIWVLHVDCDELFSTPFLENIDSIIKDTIYNAFKFPRLNLPYHEKYPDYQIRLMNKEFCKWYGDVHETVNIGKEDVFELNTYPIVHKLSDNKIKRNDRWNKMENKKRVVVLSLFHNSEKWIKRFLDSLTNSILYTLVKENVDSFEYTYDIFFIEGNSNDNTMNMLIEWNKKIVSDGIIKEHNINIIKMDISNELDRWVKLAISRNMLIKLGIKNYHDYILMIDSDIVFNENIIHKLVSSIDNNNADVVAPNIYIENFRTYGDTYFYDTLAFVKDGVCFKHYYPYSTTKHINDDILEMDSVGTCYMLKYDVFNLNELNGYNISRCIKEAESRTIVHYDGFDKSEQVGFFQYVNKKDFKVILDRNIFITHVNLEKYNVEWH